MMFTVLPAMAARGIVTDLHPPGNGGTHQGVGVIEDERGNIFDFITPDDNEGTPLSLGDPVTFDIDENGKILNVLAISIGDYGVSCKSPGTYLNFESSSETIPLIDYFRDTSNNSLIITKLIDESSPMFEEFLDEGRPVSKGSLFSCIISENGKFEYRQFGIFEKAVIESINQEATDSIALEEITFLFSTSFEQSLEKNSIDRITEIQIPDWVKNQGKWWVSNSISDDEFINAVEFLINEGIIVIPPEEISDSDENQKPIPDWIRKTVNWWSENQTSDQEMANALQYLIKLGVIRI